MRTIQQYVDWVKLCQQFDPDCAYLVHHHYRQSRATKNDYSRMGAVPLELSDVEKRLYHEGPKGLLDLDNSHLYTGGEKDQLEELLARLGFKVDKTISKKDFETSFNDIPVLCTRYEHINGVVSLQFFYGDQKPLSRANIKTRIGSSLISYYDLLEEVSSEDAELTFNACIALNHYGSRPFIPHKSRFESDKSLERTMRDNSLPLLEAIVKENILAVLMPKFATPALLNVPTT